MNASRSSSTSRSRGAVIRLGIVAGLGVAVLVALGTWQLQRRVWKLDLIERVETRVHAPPSEAPPRPDWPRITASGDEYRHVRVTGSFLNDRETPVQAVTERGAGYWILTPLQQHDGTVVLVNRGFVPPERRDPATRQATQPAGDITITGLLRMTEPGGTFLRANDPSAGRWYSRDVAAIAAARTLTDVAPYFLDEDSTPRPPEAPVGGLTVVSFYNNHLIYAITWYSLAVLLAGTTFGLLRQEWRELRPGDHPAKPPGRA